MIRPSAGSWRWACIQNTGGQHIGRLLLDESILELQGNGISTIKIIFKSQNTSAYNLYIQAGFQDTGEWKDGDLGDGVRRKILTLLLPCHDMDSPFAGGA